MSDEGEEINSSATVTPEVHQAIEVVISGEVLLAFIFQFVFRYRFSALGV